MCHSQTEDLRTTPTSGTDVYDKKSCRNSSLAKGGVSVFCPRLCFKTHNTNVDHFEIVSNCCSDLASESPSECKKSKALSANSSKIVENPAKEYLQ